MILKNNCINYTSYFLKLNANSGYDIAALNTKEICLFIKLIIMHIDQEAYIYIYIYGIWMIETPGFSFQFC